MNTPSCRSCGEPVSTRNKVRLCNRYAKCSAQRMRERNDSDRHDELCYLAFSRALGLYKIGHTTNLRTRLVVLRNGCPDIEIIETWPGGRELEREALHILAANRKIGEWIEWPASSKISIFEALRPVLGKHGAMA